MILTSKQEAGLRIAVERYKNKEPYTCISGYAGSGKTTLIRFIIEALNLYGPEDVAYVTYTGKAATVLSNKGCPNATTAHKLLYWAQPRKDGTYIFKKRPSLEQNYKLIVVDEVSMLPKEMWDLLLSHKVYVLACGDPAQLSPIDKSSDNHVLDQPHIFLDEIMRQAKESEIIRLSMDIREGKALSPYNGNEVKIIKPQDIVSGMYTWADQILCATNDTRDQINHYVRELLGHSKEPQEGDKVICLKNHWDILSEFYENSLTNGVIGYLNNYTTGTLKYPFLICDKELNYLLSDITLENGDVFGSLMLDQKLLTQGERCITPQEEYRIYKNINVVNPPLEFIYGYAITVWKAQGSEWNNVLAFEEKFPYGDEHQKYLYTTCTRASEKLVLILKE